MEFQFSTIVVALLLSCLVGLVGYWLKALYQEFRKLVSEFTKQINELTQTVMVLQVIIEKAIEEDIQELKSDVKTLYGKVNKNETAIASLKKNK